MFRESKPFFGLRELRFPESNCKYFQWPNNFNQEVISDNTALYIKNLSLRVDRFLSGIGIELQVADEVMESGYIQGSFSTPHEKWQNVAVLDDPNRRIARFAVRFDAKTDGRMHYTAMLATDQNGEVIFNTQWSDKGQWEEV